MSAIRDMEEVFKLYAQWLSYDSAREELINLLPEEVRAEIRDRFYRDMEFGTGGMRGVMGAGPNRMNEPVVAMATQGLAEYTLSQTGSKKRPAAVVCYDARRNSKHFGEVTAEVFAGNGFDVYLFKELRLTPEISFAIRELGADVGVMLTASHNPPEYNGYKAYWNDGGQLIPPHDQGSIAQIRKISSLDQVKRLPIKKAKAQKVLHYLGADMDRRFLKALSKASIDPKGNRKNGDSIQVVYTPLHGVGGTLAKKALNNWGFKKVHEVPEQIKPDSEFPTVKSPNPENPEAFEMAIALAKKAGADIAVASDPDADRMGLVARDGKGKLRFITGNQMAALFSYYICENFKSLDKMPPDPMMATTIVTTELVPLIGKDYGVDVPLTLTGFKWLGSLATQQDEARAENRPAKTFIFGCEESYGYLFGDHARDKDGIVSLCMAAEIARWAKENGTDIPGVIETIYQKYGVFDESQISTFLKGETGMERMGKIMDSLRKNPPKTIGGVKVEKVTDFWKVAFRDANGKKVKGPKQLPEANVMMFELEGRGKVVARPSGTEPKIKFYFNLCDREGAPFKNATETRKREKALALFAKKAKEDFMKFTGLDKE